MKKTMVLLVFLALALAVISAPAMARGHFGHHGYGYHHGRGYYGGYYGYRGGYYGYRGYYDYYAPPIFVPPPIIIGPAAPSPYSYSPAQPGHWETFWEYYPTTGQYRRVTRWVLD